MSLQEAKQDAKFKTLSTRINHDVIKINNDYFVFIAGKHTGNVIKTYNHEDLARPENKTKSKKIPSVPELRNTTDKEVLQGSGNE